MRISSPADSVESLIVFNDYFALHERHNTKTALSVVIFPFWEGEQCCDFCFLGRGRGTVLPRILGDIAVPTIDPPRSDGKFAGRKS